MSNHLGRFLLSAGLIDRGTLSRALEAQHRRGCALVVAVVTEGLLDEDDLYELHLFRGRFEAAPDNLVIAVSVQAMSLLPAEIAERFWVVPVRVSFDGSGARLLYLATTDPEDAHSLSELAAYTDSKVIPLVARFSLIGEALSHWYGIEVPAPVRSPGADTLDEESAPPGADTLDSGEVAVPIPAQTPAFDVDVDFDALQQAVPSSAIFAETDKTPIDESPPFSVAAEAPAPVAAEAPATAPVAAEAPAPAPVAAEVPAPAPVAAEAPRPAPVAAGAPASLAAGASAQASAAPGARPGPNPFVDMPRPQLRLSSIDGTLDSDIREPEAVPPHVAAWAGFNRLQEETEVAGAEPQRTPPEAEHAPPPEEVLEIQDADLIEERAEPRRATGPPPDEAANIIRAASSRDEAVAAALDAMSVRFKRCILFIVKPEVVQGFDARGIARNRVRGIRVPLKIPSMFKSVRDTGSPFLDRPGKGSAHAVFRSAIGGETGEVLILPVHARDKVSLMLYADAAEDRSLDLSASEIGAWVEVGRALGDLVEALLAKRETAATD